MIIRNSLVALSALVFLGTLGCPPKQQASTAGPASSTPTAPPNEPCKDNRDGTPKWLDMPDCGMPVEAICSAGQSDFASADPEAAKSDAETALKNRIAEQIEAKVGVLTERLSSAMKDLGNGKTVGQRTLKVINQNFQESTIVGLRYEEYFWHPSRTAPEKVWVRGCVTPDYAEMSQGVVDSMMTAALEEKLEMKHEEAQVRFDQVRQQYLKENSSN